MAAKNSEKAVATKNSGENVSGAKTPKNIGGIARIFGVIAVVALIIGAIIASMSQKVPNSEKIWDPEMTVGNINAKNYFVIYSDIACPYCLAFENAIVEHEEEFEKYIEENDILLEVRVSDFLYEFGESNPRSSRESAVAIYCARDAGKFWDYYNLTVTTVWNEFFAEGSKALGVTRLDATTPEYWLAIGKKVGLGEDFENCVANETPLAEIEERAAKSAKMTRGLPFFKFNSATFSGFDLSYGWEYVLKFFEAGLNS